MGGMVMTPEEYIDQMKIQEINGQDIRRMKRKYYYIVSLKNTKAKDASLTLWRPDNAGYTYFLCAAGVYDEIDPEYHGSDGNIPLEINSLVRLTVRGTDVSRCIENTRENRDLIRKMWREELKEIKKKKKR